MGYVFIIAATLWFLTLLKQEIDCGFRGVQARAFCTLFAAVGLGACLLVKSHLPVQGKFAVLLPVAGEANGGHGAMGGDG